LQRRYGLASIAARRKNPFIAGRPKLQFNHKHFTEFLPACKGYLNTLCYEVRVFAAVNNQQNEQY
jgi:hypothetical protein